jgi:hypothetical protein
LDVRGGDANCYATHAIFCLDAAMDGFQALGLEEDRPLAEMMRHQAKLKPDYLDDLPPQEPAPYANAVTELPDQISATPSFARNADSDLTALEPLLIVSSSEAFSLRNSLAFLRGVDWNCSTNAVVA